MLIWKSKFKTIKITILSLLVFLAFHKNAYAIDLTPLSLFLNALSKKDTIQVPLKENMNESDINFVVSITFNDTDTKGCTKLKPLKLKATNFDLIPGAPKKCESIKELQDAVRSQKGNLLLINSLYNGCDLKRYEAVGYFCQKPKNF